MDRRYSKSAAIRELERMANHAARERYPSIQPQDLARRTFRDDSANGLTKCITAFLKLRGHAANRIANTGRILDRRRIITDVIGNTRTIGSQTWIPGTGTNGIADIISCIDGRMVGIEIKYGSDRQRPAQKEYQRQIEAAGGIYVIARDFSGFMKWYNENFEG